MLAERQKSRSGSTSAATSAARLEAQKHIAQAVEKTSPPRPSEEQAEGTLPTSDTTTILQLQTARDTMHAALLRVADEVGSFATSDEQGAHVLMS